MPDQTSQPVQISPSPLLIPNLGDVITTDDVSQKGTGKYTADYVNWCRVAHLLHVNAPGWQFHVRPTPAGSHVWEAPNGTAYIVGYFTGPNGEVTPDFPQAVMDNRNAAVPFTKVSARDFTDTHRRCLCTAAAATFSLAWQLWAREEVENPHREEASKPTPETPHLPEDEQKLSKSDFATCVDLIKALGRGSKKQMALLSAFRKEFNVPDNADVQPRIIAVKHMKWIQKHV